MNVEFINPFINATVNALSTMANVVPTRGTPYIKTEDGNGCDISAVIGLAGEANGWVAICFERNTALRIVSNMLGEAKSFIDADVRDAVGEVVNMVAGGAKGEFSAKGRSFKLAIPTVIVGENHILSQKKDVPCIEIPFKIEGCGSFYIAVCLKVEAQANTVSAGSAAVGQ
jgi:chemotaxis protein CheX